jgi:hypothetical protein
VSGSSGEYYKTDSTRVSLREYWAWRPGLPFLYLAIRKLMGRPLPQTVFVPAIPRLVRVDANQAPPELLAALQHPIEACVAAGGGLQFYYRAPTRGTHRGLAAALLGPKGSSIALATVGEGPAGTVRQVGLGLLSRLREGRFLATSTGGTLFDPPTCMEAERLPGRPFRDIVSAHQAKVRQRAEQVIPVGPDAVESVILEVARLQIEANVQRGIYVPATEAEIARWE